MWSDEQLLAKGWTQEQIKQWRLEQTPEVARPDATTQSMVSKPVEAATSGLVVTGDNASTADVPQMGLAETGVGSFFSDKSQPLLVVMLLILAPLSMYGALFSEGPTGPAGEQGEPGENGTAGSSFHLVLRASDLPACDASVQNQIFFIAEDAGFQVCQNQAWDVIDLTGDAGAPGLDGADGAGGADGTNGTDGADGQDGTDGMDGADGSNGFTSLLITSIEPSGPNCPTGGTRVETGIDDDRDNLLSSAEVDDVVFVCDGADGTRAYRLYELGSALLPPAGVKAV